MTHSDNGFFNRYGGKYVAEVLRRPLDELETAFKEAMQDEAFLNELKTIHRDYIGRETPLLFAETATKLLGGAQIYIKLEGLANTGAHKINNAIGQCLLAKRMGKKRIIAEKVSNEYFCIFGMSVFLFRSVFILFLFCQTAESPALTGSHHYAGFNRFHYSLSA